MTMDRQFAEYRQSVEQKLSERVEGITQRASGKYRFLATGDDGRASVVPARYPGYTVLAQPYAPSALVGALQPIVDEILAAEIAGFAPVPRDTLHMTVADLVHGVDWNVPPDERKRELIWHARNALNRVATDGLEITASIRGIGCAPSVVIAVVDFEKESDYAKLMDIRNAVYSGSDLAALGVERGSPFLGHVTLGYLESAPPLGLDEVIGRINDQWVEVSYEINSAALYSFENMSGYDPVPAI